MLFSDRGKDPIVSSNMETGQKDTITQDETSTNWSLKKDEINKEINLIL